MSNQRRVAEKNLGLFSNGPADRGGGFLVPLDNLNVGPGKPGPEDEWTVPTGPIETEDGATSETVPADSTGVLPPHPTSQG
jgi:hypothetical protein